VLFSGAYGLADRERKSANKLDTRFRIGSMNKMFTAVRFCSWRRPEESGLPIQSADLVHHASRFGVRTGSTSTEMAAVSNRKREMVSALVAIHLEKYRASGAELVMGRSEIRQPENNRDTPECGRRPYHYWREGVLNLGTHASIPDTPGLRESEALTTFAGQAPRPSHSTPLKRRNCGPDRKLLI
jgi:hypothetical protein